MTRAKRSSSGEHTYTTASHIPIKPLYTPADVPDLDYERDLGFPGQPPYVRGIYPSMYRGRAFTVRQLSGYGSPDDLNERNRFLLRHGGTGLNILFDLPTICGYDSDSPRPRERWAVWHLRRI